VGGQDAIEVAAWNTIPCDPSWTHEKIALVQPAGNGSAAYGVTFDPTLFDCSQGYQVWRVHIYLCPPPGSYVGHIDVYQNNAAVTTWSYKGGKDFNIMTGTWEHVIEFDPPLSLNTTAPFTAVFWFKSGDANNVYPFWDIDGNNPTRSALAYTTNWLFRETGNTMRLENHQIGNADVSKTSDDVYHPAPAYGDFCMWADIIYHDLEVKSISSPMPSPTVYNVGDEIPVTAWLINNSAWPEGNREVRWTVTGTTQTSKEVVNFVADYNNPAFTFTQGLAPKIVVPPEWAGQTKTCKVDIIAGSKLEWNANNNVKSVSFKIAPRVDVKAVSIDVPSGDILRNVTITPKVTLKNLGSNAVSGVQATLKFFDVGHNQVWTKTVTTSLSLNQTKQISVGTWKPLVNGDYTSELTVVAAGDVNPADNQADGDFTVRDVLCDVGATGFVSPSGNVERGDPVAVEVAVENFGNTTASFPVVCQVKHAGQTYEYRQEVADLQGGTARTVTFLTRRFRSVGGWSMQAWTEMPGDPNQQNNSSEIAFSVTGQAGWYVSYNIPGDVPVNKGAAMANTGSGFYLMKGKKDGKVYGFAEDLDEAKVAGEMPQQAGNGTQMADLDGVLYVLMANKTFGFYALKDGRWTQLADLPAGASAKPAKNGASMAVAGGMVYVLKGNKTTEAYRYNPVLNSWEALPNIPSAGGRQAKDGTSLTSDGSRVFALLGNKSREFYTFDGAAWQRLADLPANAKAGTVLGYMDGMVYAAVGGGVSFYGYDVQMNSWSVLPEVPRVVDTKKVGAGSAMTVVDGSVLLVKKAKTLYIMGYSPDSYLCGVKKTAEGVQAATGVVKTALSVASPVQNVLRLSHTLRGPVYVQLYTSSGTLVRSLTTARSSAELSVSGLASGSYLLRVSSNGQTETRQVVIQ